jgi:hypothetical protein
MGGEARFQAASVDLIAPADDIQEIIDCRWRWHV